MSEQSCGCCGGKRRVMVRYQMPPSCGPSVEWAVEDCPHCDGTGWEPPSEDDEFGTAEAEYVA